MAEGDGPPPVYSGCSDPVRVRSLFVTPAVRAQAAGRAQGRSDDHAFGALGAELYEPKRRIGFLVRRPCFGQHAIHMLDFAGKIKRKLKPER